MQEIQPNIPGKLKVFTDVNYVHVIFFQDYSLIEKALLFERFSKNLSRIYYYVATYSFL